MELDTYNELLSLYETDEYQTRLLSIFNNQ